MERASIVHEADVPRVAILGAIPEPHGQLRLGRDPRVRPHLSVPRVHPLTPLTLRVDIHGIDREARRHLVGDRHRGPTAPRGVPPQVEA